MLDSVFETILSFVPLVLAITLHEAAHGYMALKCGDDTARRMGRLTLNPLKHVDLVGTLLLPFLLFLIKAPFLFGYAKPVPVNFHRLRHPRLDMVWVALAGPGMNIFLAVLSLLCLKILAASAVGIPLLSNALVTSFWMNIYLAVLNMVPLPPLDGGRVAVGLLPLSLAKPLERIEPYGFFILTGLLFLPSLLGLHPNPFMAFLQKISGGIAQGLATLCGVS